MNENPVIVTHVITDVGMGGAEMMLYELLKNIQNKRIKFYVVSLSGTDIIGEKIKDLGIDLTVLNINPKLPNPIKIFKLLKTLNKQRPDVVHTWMYHADFLGGIAAWLLKTKHIIWHIHNSTLSDSSKISATRIIQKLNSYLSHYIPTKIISCSLKAKEIHVNIGYDQKKFEFIPNGFDTDKFKKEIETKNKIRKEINIPSSSKVIGMVGRYNPQKDLGNFIAAANMLIKQGNEVFFVLCGKGLTSDNHKLKNLIDEEALKYFRLLGLRTNIPNLLNSFDLFSLSSAYGEGKSVV